MILHDAYAALKRLGLVANHAGFSEDYLNKGPRYYDHLICSRKAPAVAALVSLHARVRAVADGFARAGLAAAAELDALARAAWAEAERRSCAALPPRRKRLAFARAMRGAETMPRR